MKLRVIFIFLFCLSGSFKYVKTSDLNATAQNTAVSTIIREPLALFLKDIYEYLMKKPVQKGIRYVRKLIYYRKILRWARLWWVLLSREIVGPNGHIDKRSNRVLRRIWEECAIAVYNNSLNSVDSKPLLILHAVLNECKENYASKLRNDPDMVVQKIDKILKSEIYRFWVAQEYLNIGRSNLLYTKIKPSMVPYVPSKYTLHHVSKYMEGKLKSLESKKDLDIGKYDVDIRS